MTPRQAALSQGFWTHSKPKPSFPAPRPSLHSDYCMICSRLLTPGALILAGIARTTNAVVLVGKCCEAELTELLLYGLHSRGSDDNAACSSCTI